MQVWCGSHDEALYKSTTFFTFLCYVYFDTDVSAVNGRVSGDSAGSGPVPTATEVVLHQPDAVHRPVCSVRLRIALRRLTILRHRLKTVLLR